VIQRRPNGRYAVTCYDPTLKRRRQVGTYDRLKDARAAENAAKAARAPGDAETVVSFAARWPIDFPRPKASTTRHNTERVSDFARLHGRLRMADVDSRLVDRYLSADPARKQRVPALRAMFNDAKRRGIVTHNPFAELGLSRTRGNRDRPPPSQEQVARMLDIAWRITPPSFAAWLQCATATGMRPGELDALRWHRVDLGRDEIDVREQWNAGARQFTAPKNGKPRVIAITPPARDALLRLPRGDGFVFPNLRGSYWTPSSRTFHWNRVRAKADLDGFTLYVCTRHFAAWYMLNVLGLPASVVAHQLGHEDGGRLVELTYGHRERARSLDAIKRAWAAEVRPLRAVREDTA
jgi:integrase